MKGFVLLFASLVLSSCVNPLAAHEFPLQVTTEGMVFALPAAGGADVPFAATNSGSEPLFLARCGERIMAAVDRLKNGRWTQYSGDVCQAIHPMDPLRLAGGDTVRGVQGVREAGRYRLRLAVVGGSPDDTGSTEVYSTTFTLELAPGDSGSR